MRPRPGRTSPGTCQGFMGCRPVGRERQDAGHTARSCFVWPRHLERVTYLLAYGWAYCKRASDERFDKSFLLSYRSYPPMNGRMAKAITRRDSQMTYDNEA